MIRRPSERSSATHRPALTGPSMRICHKTFGIRPGKQRQAQWRREAGPSVGTTIARVALRKTLNDRLTTAANTIGAVPRSSRSANLRCPPRQQNLRA